MSVSMASDRGGRSMTMVLIAAACVVVGERTVRAASMTYLSQTRTVYSDAGGVYEANPNSSRYRTQTAAGFGPFDGDVFSFSDAGWPYGSDYGQATQHSVLLPTLMQAFGRVGGRDQVGTHGTGTGVGDSRFTVSFALDAATAYDFDLNVAGTIGYENGSGFVFVHFNYFASLVGPNGTVFDTGKLSAAGRKTYSGQLAAGTYTLDLRIPNGHTGYGSSEASANYTAALNVPESASLGLFGTTGLLLGRRGTRRGSSRRAV